MLDGAARAVMGLFFQQLIDALGGQAKPKWWQRLRYAARENLD